MTGLSVKVGLTPPLGMGASSPIGIEKQSKIKFLPKSVSNYYVKVGGLTPLLGMGAFLSREIEKYSFCLRVREFH